MPPKRNRRPARRTSFQPSTQTSSKAGKSRRGKEKGPRNANSKTTENPPAVTDSAQPSNNPGVSNHIDTHSYNAATTAAAFPPRDDTSSAGYNEASHRHVVRQPSGDNQGRPLQPQDNGSQAIQGSHSGNGASGPGQIAAAHHQVIPAAIGGQMSPPAPAHGSHGNNATNQQGMFLQSQSFDNYNDQSMSSLPSSSDSSSQVSGVNQVLDVPDSGPGMHDPVSGHIPQKIKEKVWRGEYIHFGLLLKTAKELAADPMLDGDLVLKGGTLTVINKKSDSIHNIHTWTNAFIIYMDILLDKWPGKAKEYLKYMHNIRLAATRNANGWVAYDEQFRLKKVRFPSSSWGLIDQELWIVHVATHYSTNLPASASSSGYESRQFNVHVGQNTGNNQSTFQSRTGGGFQRVRQRCFRFQEDRCTFGKKCKFEHKCSKCGSVTHGAVRCRN